MAKEDDTLTIWRIDRLGIRLQQKPVKTAGISLPRRVVPQFQHGQNRLGHADVINYIPMGELVMSGALRNTRFQARARTLRPMLSWPPPSERDPYVDHQR